MIMQWLSWWLDWWSAISCSGRRSLILLMVPSRWTTWRTLYGPPPRPLRLPLRFITTAWKRSFQTIFMRPPWILPWEHRRLSRWSMLLRRPPKGTWRTSMETDISVQVSQITQSISDIAAHLALVTADVAKKQAVVNSLQAALDALKS